MRFLISLLCFTAIALSCSKKKKSKNDAPPAGDAPADTTTDPNDGSSGDPQDPGTKASIVGVVNVDTADVPSSTDQLLISSEIGVIAPKDEANLSTVGTVNITTSTSLRTATASDTDYDKDQVAVTVDDESMAMLRIPNGLLCVLGQTGYTAFVNKGAYVSMVDEEGCLRRGKAVSEDNNIKPHVLQRMVVEATRDGDDKPIVVKGWVDISLDTEGQEFQRFSLKLISARGANKANPFGIFRLFYKGFQIQSGAATSTVSARGFVDAFEDADGNVYVKHYDSNGGFGGNPGTTKTIAKLTYDAATSKNTEGYMKKLLFDGLTPDLPPDAGGASTEETVAYDSTHYLYKDKDANSECRDRAHPDSKIYQYGVYDKTTKNRVFSAQSSAVISKTDDNDVLQYGVAAPQNVIIPGMDLTAGDTVSVYERNGQGQITGSSTYVVKVAPGTFFTRKTPTVDTNLAKAGEYITADYTVGPNDPVLSYVRWNETQSQFDVFALENLATSKYEPITPRKLVPSGQTALLSLSPSLGSEYEATFTDNTNQAITGVKLQDQWEISGSYTTDKVFYCPRNCLKYEITPAIITAGKSDTSAFELSAAPDEAHMYKYVLEASTQKLYFMDGSTRREIFDPSVPEATLNDPDIDGLINMRMISETDYLNRGSYSYSDLINEAPDGYYQWSYSSKAENRPTFLVRQSDNKILELHDLPRVTHVLKAKDLIFGTPKSPYVAGTSVRLVVDELGFLAKLPRETDADSGKSSPMIRLAPGTALGDYIVKPLFVGETMPKLAAGDCGDLTSKSVALDPPSGSEYEDPDTNQPSLTSSSPKVVAGKILAQ